MNRHVAAALLAALALAACQKERAAGPGQKKTGPAVAKGDGIVITADEFKARLEEQSPFIRARFNTLERKKEFLDNLVRFEVLAREAEKQGLHQDPEVVLMMRRVMVQKLVQRSFQSDQDAAKSVPEPELQKYFKEHEAEYKRPARVRVAHLLVRAPADGPERAKREADARKLAARAGAEEKKAAGSFARLVQESSDDAATKPAGGDLGFRSKEELAAQLSPAAAEAAFALQDGQISAVVASAQGFHVLKRTGWQDPVDRPFDAVKAQIANKLARDKRTKDFDDLVKRLKDEAKVIVDDKELEKVTVAGAAPGADPGAHGAPPGMPPPGMPPAGPASPARP